MKATYFVLGGAVALATRGDWLDAAGWCACVGFVMLRARALARLWPDAAILAVVRD